MSYIQRELDRIGNALRNSQFGERYAELYLAQQALSWALEPNGFAPPTALIEGIPEDSKDCLSESDPAPFLCVPVFAESRERR